MQIKEINKLLGELKKSLANLICGVFILCLISSLVIFDLVSVFNIPLFSDFSYSSIYGFLLLVNLIFPGTAIELDFYKDPIGTLLSMSIGFFIFWIIARVFAYITFNL